MMCVIAKALRVLGHNRIYDKYKFFWVHTTLLVCRLEKTVRMYEMEYLEMPPPQIFIFHTKENSNFAKTTKWLFFLSRCRIQAFRDMRGLERACAGAR